MTDTRIQVPCQICKGTGEGAIDEVPVCIACGGVGTEPAPREIKRYTKIPVTIEAVQLTWNNWNAVCAFVPKPWFIAGCYLCDNGKPTNDCNGRLGLRMKTLESQEFIAQEGDYIIRGIEGEFYACNPSVFNKTYREANGD